MIHLENTDKQWIKLCKGHYEKEYPYQGTWINTLKPLFIKLCGSRCVYGYYKMREL